MTERRRKGDRREKLALVGGFLAICLMFFLQHQQGSIILSQHRRLLRAERRLSREQAEIREQALALGSEYRSTIEACVRLQVVRIEDNVSHYADYRVFKTVLMLSRLALREGRVPAARLHDELTFLRPLGEAVRAKTWVPPTNCRYAVGVHGVHYRAARPVPFYKALPPPSALTLNPSDFR